eukprot:5058980-Pleurochrysis_carterae.AAC.1
MAASGVRPAYRARGLMHVCVCVCVRASVRVRRGEGVVQRVKVHEGGEGAAHLGVVDPDETELPMCPCTDVFWQFVTITSGVPADRGEVAKWRRRLGSEAQCADSGVALGDNTVCPPLKEAPCTLPKLSAGQARKSPPLPPHAPAPPPVAPMSARPRLAPLTPMSASASTLPCVMARPLPLQVAVAVECGEAVAEPTAIGVNTPSLDAMLTHKPGYGAALLTFPPSALTPPRSTQASAAGALAALAAFAAAVAAFADVAADLGRTNESRRERELRERSGVE